MKVLDLFSGIGGFALAAQWMGWEHAAFVEKEPFCQKVLAKNFPGVPVYDDVFDFDIRSLTEAMEARFSDEQKDFVDMSAKRKDYDNAVSLYRNGLSIAQVAERYGMSRQAMWAILKRRGVEFRPNLRYGEENHFHRGSAADDAAQNKLEKAIKRGEVQRKEECEFCGDSGTFRNGRTKIQAHHCDYNKPLEVIWLCQKCHHNWHKENQAIPRKEAQGAEEVNRLYSIQVLTGGFP